MEFFKGIGFTFNLQFTSEDTTCMVISEHIYVMLLEEARFKSFTNKEIPNTFHSAQMIIGLSVDSREKVNQIVNNAFAAGAIRYNDPVDYGFMYSWSFQDIDNHLWEIIYMDPNHVQ